MSIDKSLVESFDLEGRWGLPDWSANNWLHGKAHFDPQAGISLEIDGLFGDVPKQIPSKLDGYAAVYGVTRDAKRVTLLNVIGGLGGMAFGPAGANVRGKYHASRMIAGEYLASWADQKYRSVRIQFHNLEEFLGKHGFNEDVAEGAASVSFKTPAPLELLLEGIPVKGEYYGGIRGDIFTGREVWQQAWFTATLQSETHIDDLLSGPFASLHYLLEFSVGHRIPMTEIEADSARTEIDVNGKTAHNPVKIFVAQKRPLPLPPREHPLRMLFTLAGFGEQSNDYVQKWHKGFKSFRDALDFFFSLDPEFDTDVALEHHFLTNANAFEALHRTVGKTQFERSEDEHNARITEILGSAPSKFRSWLKGKLRHSNEISLERRLREAYTGTPEQLRTLLGSGDFAQR